MSLPISSRQRRQMATRLLHQELRRASPEGASAFTIGTFDGVHRGHQFLIRLLRLRAAAFGLASGVVVLHPHPLTVVRPGTRVTYLSGLDERIELLSELGVDAVAPVTFTSEVSQISAEDFVREMVHALQLRFLLLGPDSALGRDREGAGAHLAEIGARLGVDVEFAPAESEDGHKIGSSDIRAALDQGDIERVSYLLGRGYCLSGPVIHGAERGRSIGVPTANIAVAPDRAIPAFGVYAGHASIGETSYRAAINVGRRPTFDNGAPSVEAHLLDFDEDIYGQDLGIEFVHRLRGEVKFESVQALLIQIKEDIAATRALGL